MSNNLTLIKYRLGSNGRHIEESGEVIASSFVSDDLLSELIKIAPLATLNIYEEEGSDEYSDTECLHNEKLSEILSLVKKVFIGLLETERAPNFENNEDEFRNLISEFRSITNLYQLLEIKYLKYKNDDTVIIKLG